jgi:long-chain acyl-CoA synthetase
MLGELLSSVAKTDPRRTALVVEGHELSYNEVDARVRAFAGALRRQGLAPGDRVAFRLPNGVEAAVCHFACFVGGFIGVPCNTRLTSGEIAFVLEHSGAGVYIDGPEAYARLASGGGPPQPLPDVDPDAGAVILYTSGSTARPKGALHTHRSLRACARLWAAAASLGPHDRMLVMSPMMHMSGMCALVTTMSAGAIAVIVPVMDPAAALDAIEQAGCTQTFGLPVAYHLLVREQARAPRRVHTLRMAIGGGDSVPPALIHAFRTAFGVPILEGHGMSECAPNIVNPPGGERAGSLGVPVPGVEARVDAAPGGTGELLLRTPAMFRGYWGDEDETRRAFDGGFLRTGDLARVDADGFFWFAGRRKEIIVHGGVNVSPQEVEEVLCGHAAVALAGVVGLPDPVWGESVHAVVVLKPGAATTCAELRAFVAGRLAEWKVPGSIAVEDELPIGPTGKVQRRLLRERLGLVRAGSA